MAKLTNSDLAAVLVNKKGLTKKEAIQFVNELFVVVRKGLQEDKLVKVKGLGTFKIIEVDDRESVNVNTGERVLIEGHSKISFIPDSLMKELVNKPFSQFETVVLRDGVDFTDMAATSENEQENEIEPESAPEPTPVVEPEEPKPEPEQEVEPEPEPEPEPEVVPEEETEPEPLVELEPLDEPTPLEEPEQQEEPKDVVDSESSTTPLVDFETDEEESASGFNWIKWLTAAVFCILIFGGGYYVGKIATGPQEVKTNEQKETPAKKKVAKPVQTVTAVAQEVKKDTLKKVESQPAHNVAQMVAPAEDFDKYEQMDARIRTGAYRIVGTDHTEKVRATDNLARICKRTIGPGMECYLTAYNGIKSDADLKPGMEIKIPKLERKKKKAKIEN